MNNPSADVLVSTYMKLRNAIDEREEQIKGLKEKQQVISNQLLELCNEQNLDSLRTPFGTVSRRLSSTYWTSDWDAMYNFIQEHNAPHLLQKRLHDGNLKEFLGENPEDVPPGLQSKRAYVITVRKPSTK